MMKRKGFTIFIIIVILVGMAGALIMPYGYAKKKLEKLGGKGELDIVIYTSDAEQNWKKECYITGDKDNSEAFNGVAAFENKLVELYYDSADKLIFEGFSICNYLSEGLGSYLFAILKDKVGNVYITKEQLMSIMQEQDTNISLPDLGVITEKLENIDLRVCFDKSKSFNDDAEGIWFTLGDNLYLCLQNSAADEVKLVLFYQQKDKMHKVEVEFCENPEIERITMPQTVPDEMIYIVKQGYELWKLLGAEKG